MKKIVSLSALALAVVLLAGCTSTTRPNDNASGTSELTAQTSAPATTDTTSNDSQVMDASVKTINLESFSYGFTPNKIEVKKGDKVKLNIKNTGGFHSFELKDFNIDQNTPADQVTTVEFTADKAGTFEFICGVGNHAQQGQKGTLVVTE